MVQIKIQSRRHNALKLLFKINMFITLLIAKINSWILLIKLPLLSPDASFCQLMMVLQVL